MSTDEEMRYDDDSNSAEFADIEDLFPSEEEQQAAISRVAFDWCETVREAGDRYREGASIPVLAVDFEIPMEKALRAVKTYYLVFSEAPIDGVRGIVYSNGQRYFRENFGIHELNAKTREEAEEHVQAFVGRALLENELDAVDIEKPVPEMEVPMIQELDEVVGSQLGRTLESVKEQFTISSPFGSNQLLNQRLASQVGSGWQQKVGEMQKQNVRQFQQAVRATGVGKSPVTHSLAASAGISSMVASSAMAGFEPSLFQMMGQPAAMSVVNAVQTIPEVYFSPVGQIIGAMSQPVVQQISQQVQPFSVFPALQISDFLEQHRLQIFAPFVNQTNTLSDAMVGVGTMGAMAARPEVRQGFDEPEKPWSPAQPKIELSVPGTNWDWGLIDRIRSQSSDILIIVVSGVETGAVGYLSWVYPNHQLLIVGAGVTVGALLKIALILSLVDNQLDS